MQNTITVCNRICDKGMKCPYHTAKIPNYYNHRLIEYKNFEKSEECLKRKEVKNK